MAEFLSHLTERVRSAALIDMADKVAGATVLAETMHCRILQVTADPDDIVKDTRPPPENNLGASYAQYVHIVHLDLRAWRYSGLFSVAMVNNRLGQSAIDFAVELLLENIVELTLTAPDGDTLLYSLVENDTDLSQLVVSARIIGQITLCGRCDGVGQEPPRLGTGTCGACNGAGRETKIAQAA